ncbi:hypothetical protein [Lacipirellula limnantheis]|uniref:PEP-CTERM protein-sorting domain-containing protein n=1 Tax=Lacipirellula limnantheis TaxID=2528024 RepID=A0A517U4T4_9BACT|nr:hypothetical protein [Lacipirellula limnantheis]QDT75644.1 hypothetical protein I41_48840 [Lacipirellula limnantheis]
MKARNLRQQRLATTKLRLACVLAAGAAMSMCCNCAEAAIHYYVGYIEVALGSEQPINVNFEGDGYDDIVLQNDVANGNVFQSLYIPYSPGKVAGFSAGDDYISDLPRGAAVNATTIGSLWQGTLAHGALAPASQFNDVTDAFIGFAFPIGPTNLYYGWLRLDVDNAAGTMLLKDWAYEDQLGVGIATGDVGIGPIAGDFDGNLRVDGADFLRWQRGLGTTYSTFDLFDWKRNYGGGLGLMPTVSAVPEPAAFGLAAAGAIAMMYKDRNAAKPARQE